MHNIKLDPSNPNVLTDEQMEGLRESMRKFGYLQPIIVDQDFLVADGEHRLAIYKEFGRKEVPCYILRLKDEERRLLRQTMNKLRGSHDVERDAAELKILFDGSELDELAHLVAGSKDDYLRLLENYYDIPYEVAGTDGPKAKIGALPSGEFHRVIQGEVRGALKALAASCVDCVMTSPPYWALRNYGKSLEVNWEDGWHGQLGLEPDYTLFVNHLVECFREFKRVLAPHGSLYINLGDTYWGGGHENNFDALNKAVTKKQPRGKYEKAPDYLPRLEWTESSAVQPKSLVAIPQRFMLAMIDDGWICRNVIIWHKPNHMPTSVRDRFSTGYEFIYFFVKQERYYFDLDAVREPHTASGDLSSGHATKKTAAKYSDPLNKGAVKKPRAGFALGGKNPGDTLSVSPQLGRGWANNPGHAHGHDRKYNPEADGSDYWDVATRPFPGAHFATFPPALVIRPLLASCPEAVCSDCGTPVAGTKCDCRAPFRPGVIMDPFAGSGTVAMVAKRFHRSSISVELNPRYCDMIKQRIGFDDHGDGAVKYEFLAIKS